MSTRTKARRTHAGSDAREAFRNVTHHAGAACWGAVIAVAVGAVVEGAPGPRVGEGGGATSSSARTPVSPPRSPSRSRSATASPSDLGGGDRRGRGDGSRPIAPRRARDASRKSDASPRVDAETRRAADSARGRRGARARGAPPRVAADVVAARIRADRRGAARVCAPRGTSPSHLPRAGLDFRGPESPSAARFWRERAASSRDG